MHLELYKEPSELMFKDVGTLTSKTTADQIRTVRRVYEVPFFNYERGDGAISQDGNRGHASRRPAGKIYHGADLCGQPRLPRMGGYVETGPDKRHSERDLGGNPSGPLSFFQFDALRNSLSVISRLA